MEVLRIPLLSLLLWMAYVTYAVTGVDLPPIYGKVGEEVNLRCPSGEGKLDEYRAWYRGKFDKGSAPPDEKKIYRGRGTKIGTGDMHRGDMKLDTTSFMLTLTIQNNPSDQDFFTCVTEVEPKEYDRTEVLIFLQPEIVITRDKQPEEGINVTVTCEVERLYPNITSNQFTMRWGNQNAREPEFSGVMNTDGSMKYTLEKMKNLTQDDNGLTVACTVTPDKNFGEPVTESLVLNFTMGPTEHPGGGGSNIGATIGRVISGLVAVVIAVAISGSGTT